MKLEIIKGLYYDPNNQLKFKDVTEELRKRTKDNELVLDGYYNDIFSSDPAPRIVKALNIELKIGEIYYHISYKENQKINLPEDLGIDKSTIKNDSSDRKWYYNPLFLAILPFILGLIFLGNKVIRDNKNTTQTNNNGANISQINNNGDNIIGNKTVVNQFNSDSNSQQIDKNSLLLPIFSLYEKMSNFSGTSIEKDEFFLKYIGLTVNDEGYVDDVSSFSDIQTSVFLSKEENNYSTVMCQFDSDWTKAVVTLQINQKIRFSGVVKKYLSSHIILQKCSLQ